MLALLLACQDAPKNKADPDQEPSSLLGPSDLTDPRWEPILTEDDRLSDPRDLGFDADGNLWVANRSDDRTFVVLDPGTGDQEVERLIDGYAEHFMEETAALSFDDNAQFGSCGESSNTYNDRVPGNNYMGPVLWSTDLNIFGEENPIGLGSHLDMSHESPLCVGIAWEDANVYWVFDGHNSALVRHDFNRDHGVGMDEHFDGVIAQFTEPELKHVQEAPGHIVIDRENRMLYVADTGNGRVLWFDIDSGEAGDGLRAHDPGVVREEWEGALWGVVADGLDKPGGLALHGDRLIVAEWGTGMLYDFDLDGELIRSIDTEVGPEALYGIEAGPDGRLWVTETATPAVLRLDVD